LLAFISTVTKLWVPRNLMNLFTRRVPITISRMTVRYAGQHVDISSVSDRICMHCN
jgi:hypothetical protein